MFFEKKDSSTVGKNVYAICIMEDNQQNFTGTLFLCDNLISHKVG